MFEDEARDEAMAELARCASRCLEGYGFVVAGGTALRLHGITDRPSEDIDLFTTWEAIGLTWPAPRGPGFQAEIEFDLFAEAFAANLRERGYKASVESAEPFHVRVCTEKDGYEIECDLYVQDEIMPPVLIDDVTVSDRYDAVRGKFAALFDRSMPGDYYDAYRAASSDGITLEEAMWLAREDNRGRGAELAEELEGMSDAQFIRSYGMEADEIAGMRAFMMEWLNS